MAAANPLWGAPRIHGELGKVGVVICERTVSRLLRHSRRSPSQTWRTFLTNHVPTLVSMDFFTVPTLTGRVLFVFVLLATAAGASSISMSPSIQQRNGRHSKSLKPSQTTPHRDGR